VLLEEGAKRFQAGTIYASEETTQTGTVRKVSTSKQSHERSFKGGQALEEVGKRAFSADGIAEKPRQKIKRFIAAEASMHQTNLL
jgi:hypothetical protein